MSNTYPDELTELEELQRELARLESEEETRREAFEASIEPLEQRIYDLKVRQWQVAMSEPILHVSDELQLTEDFRRHIARANDDYVVRQWPLGGEAIILALNPNSQTLHIRNTTPDKSGEFLSIPFAIVHAMRKLYLESAAKS